ncbi:MAG: PLP-dependent transferase [Thermomicrobiales bacterium]|nr:PLP-dependent transferase [Thermomicrobiales bacterium]
MAIEEQRVWQRSGFASRAVHAGERADRAGFTPTATPIFTSNSYYADAATSDAVFGGERPGFVYTRYGNPTTQALETAIAALEGTEAAVAYASGMAALHAGILGDVRAGSRIVASKALYGATAALRTNLFATMGVETTFVDIFDLTEVERVVAQVKPRVLLFETISNPLVRVANIPALVEIARSARATTVIDNTFATPYLVNPARFGVDVIVHSTTKYFGGHGDVTGGAIATTSERAFELVEMVKLTGGIPGPFESWLTLRGIKTLPLRMRQQCQNAATIARWLQDHPRVARVHYPGLGCDGENAAIFNNHLRGGMLAFEVKDANQATIFRLLDGLKLCQPATTLGDVYTLVLYPPMSTHRGFSPAERAEAGITDGLVRLSAGIEDVEDVIADLDQALAIAE